MEYLIETRSLTKTYRVGSETVQALRGVSVRIQKGEFVAVMGPSGSGKSTFMNLLGCLDRPTSGEYLLDGTPASTLQPRELAAVRNKKIGFVFQNFNLLPRTTAADNVELPLRYARLPRHYRKSRATEVLAQVGLAERSSHFPSQLSGGQQQRVAIGRALAGNPPLILADEPTGALDTRTGFEIMGLFQKLNRDGQTIVLVTHELDVAHFAGRIIFFRDGELASDQKIDSPNQAETMLKNLPQEQKDPVACLD